MDNATLWQQVLGNIRLSVSKANFSTWFAPTHLIKIKKINSQRQIVEIGCPSPFIADGIEKRYFGLLQNALNEVTNLKNDLFLTINQLDKKPEKENTPLFRQEVPGAEEVEEALKKTKIRPGFTFENFAVSATNQMAWAAAETVAKNPGKSYNPLFLYGEVGIGKTHLMLAIGNAILKSRPSIPALYCTGEDFTNEIVHAIRNKNTQNFKDKYRKLKLLLIDDIQFIAGKDYVQEEFFHTFDALQNAGGQVVLAADNPPGEIKKLEKRIFTRLQAGLVMDISPPDFELRTAIALIKSKERGVPLNMEMAQSIAEKLEAPRQIEGFVVKLLQISKQELSLELVNKLLGKKGMVNGEIKHISPQDVVNAACAYFNISKRKLLGESRIQIVALPRQILMYLLRTEMKLSLQEVGRVVGGRDHTTVMHAVEKISKNLKADVNLKDNILGIKKQIS